MIDSLPLLRISAHAHLMEHVGRQADHGEVVNNEDGSEVDGLPVFHQAGSKPDHTEVEKEDESHGNWGIDQQPGVCPLVWNRREDTVTQSLQGSVQKLLHEVGETGCNNVSSNNRVQKNPSALHSKSTRHHSKNPRCVWDDVLMTLLGADEKKRADN